MGFVKNKLEKKSRSINAGLLKKQILDNLILRRKIFILKSLTMLKIVKGDPWGVLKIQFVAKLQKNWRKDLSETSKSFRKKSQKAENWKGTHFGAMRNSKGGPFWFRMVLCFMLEAFDAIKYWILTVKVHHTHKVDPSEWDWQKI